MINVTCGIILKDSRVLVTQRSEKMQLALKWEFPGERLKQTKLLSLQKIAEPKGN
jgi:8-oxo-dGTP diphosphatase